MSSKYHGLPDIDTAPDVFETADEPDSLLRPQESALGDEDSTPRLPVSELIDVTALPDRLKTEKVFRRSKRLEPFRFRYDPSSGSEDEKVLIKEMPLARIRRLKAELKEVEKEVAAMSAKETGEGKRRSVLPPKEPADLVKEVSGLRERLENLQVDRTEGGVGGEWKERLSQLGTAGASGSRLDAYKVDDGALGLDGGAGAGSGGGGGVKLSELDTRLATLEGIVGSAGSGLDEVSPPRVLLPLPSSPTDTSQSQSPLLPTIFKLDHLLSLLTQPRHLDAISRRVKLLLVDLDRAATASRRTNGTAGTAPPNASTTPNTLTLSEAEYQSLQSLFNVLPRLDPLIPILQPLLIRLRSLAVLHSQAGDIADGLRKLNVEDKRDAEERVELENVLGQVRDGLESAGKRIGKNWEGLEGRMKGLERRLNALEG